jgi:hypothetical protein
MREAVDCCCCWRREDITSTAVDDDEVVAAGVTTEHIDLLAPGKMLIFTPFSSHSYPSLKE